MRLARLYATEYGKLKLNRVPDADRADLHVMMEVLWQLDHVQQDTRGAEHKEALKARKRMLREVLEEFRQRDRRIKLCFRERNGHISAASNSALELAGGEFATSDQGRCRRAAVDRSGWQQRWLAANLISPMLTARETTISTVRTRRRRKFRQT